MCAYAGSLVDLGFSVDESRHALNVSPGNTSKARSILTAHRLLEERLNNGPGSSALADLSNSARPVQGERQRSEQPTAEDVKLTKKEKIAISAVLASDRVRLSLGLQEAAADESVEVDFDTDTPEVVRLPPALQPGGLWALAEEHEASSSSGSADSSVHDPDFQAVQMVAIEDALPVKSGRVSPSYMQPTKSSRARSPEPVADEMEQPDGVPEAGAGAGAGA